jgi:hypothetical protein
MSIKLSTGAWAEWLSNKSLKNTFANGVLAIYSGSQRSDADAAETGDLLALVTIDGGSFTPGTATNGLNLDTTTSAAISKVATETWKGDYLAEGTMGWFCFYDNAKTTGSSTTAKRIDGTVGTSSRADLQVVSTAATVGGSITINSFKLNFSIV